LSLGNNRGEVPEQDAGINETSCEAVAVRRESKAVDILPIGIDLLQLAAGVEVPYVDCGSGQLGRIICGSRREYASVCRQAEASQVPTGARIDAVEQLRTGNFPKADVFVVSVGNHCLALAGKVDKEGCGRVGKPTPHDTRRGIAEGNMSLSAAVIRFAGSNS
jgi:hypothetical protein